jgi:hypothetical protein
MADKVDKPKKKAKAKKDEKGVLAALPSTRPERIGGRRSAAASRPAPKTTAAAKPATKRSAATKTAAKSSTTATRSATGKRPATAKKTSSPREERSYPRPRPVSEGAPGIGTAGSRDQPSDESGRPSGVELATTAVKAAGEVAQLGLTIGGHVLKRVVDRLPKP